ncbi:acyl-CoA dehydrogenase [Actinomadura mexicana]|uniref:Acyl-CoA dehydrogenase n=1 Tax=Actinomadura mexicana TaxID=134959 RepID=A0A238XN78_9ACTN|nr:acyl-CoA dehydrogenase [Actinomadura mexicana]SNR59814.1 Acyl-CoA dehydrogenase [Actinomadura mexicana]
MPVATDMERVPAEAAELLTRQWRFPDSASDADLVGLWRSAAAQGWFAFGDGDPLAAVLALTRATGAAACPLPVMDGFVAALLLAAVPGTAADIAAGTMRILVVPGPATPAVSCVESGMAASHVLALPAAGGRASVCPVDDAIPQPGLAMPSWARLHLGGPEAGIEIDPVRAGQALSLLRLGLAVRALAAARHAHDQSVAHAKRRRQFGRPIGGFGAVQQRTASREIDLVAGELLVEDTMRRYDARSPDWAFSAELAVSHAAAAAPLVQVGAHHTLGATGYYEEHDAPWLFRRVHADIVRLQAYAPPQGTVADVLVGTGAGLPSADTDPGAVALRDQVRSFCAEVSSRPRLIDEEDDPAVVAAMAARGWFGMTWPAADGGSGATLTEQLALQDEAAYHQLPVTNAMAAVSVIGEPVVEHGTAEQKGKYLPLIREGKLTFCLGYSEPDAGSDLSSLKTVAVRDGEDWVISGTKTWITNAHTAEYIWLAARTDQDARPALAGISMFIVPMAAPGITTRRHRALSGQVTCTVDLDRVRVADRARVGGVNRGWQVITDTLTGERLMLAGRLAAMTRRQFDELVAAVRADPDGTVGPPGSQKRAGLGDLAVKTHAAGLLLAEAARSAQSGPAHEARLVSSMAGVLVAEVADSFGRGALDILGPEAALGTSEAPGAGIFEYGLRLSILAFLGGGTNDVQRGLIARGLGLS